MRFKKIQPKGQLSLVFDKPWYPKKPSEMNIHKKANIIDEVLGISKIDSDKDKVKDKLIEIERIYKEKEKKLSEGWYTFNKPNL